MNWEKRDARLPALLVEWRERDTHTHTHTSRSEVKEVKFEQILHHGGRPMIKIFNIFCSFVRRVYKILEKQLLVSPCLSVLPSFRMEQLVSNLTDIHEI